MARSRVFAQRVDAPVQVPRSDENEFLGPYGLRSLSRHHLENPFVFNETHMGVLDATAVSARLNGLLAGIRQP